MVANDVKDFTTLEGFVNKGQTERAEILRHAGWEPEEQDMDIGTFIGTDIVLAALIRSVTTVCLAKKEAAMKEFYDNELHKIQHHFTTSQHEQELAVYYSSVSSNVHVANMEIGKTDRAEYAHLQQSGNPPTGILIEMEEQIWENFKNAEDSSSKKEGKKRCHVTQDGYDNNSDDMVRVQASKATESIHASNFSNTRRRYYAKINTGTCKKSETEVDQELQKLFNKERFQTEIATKNGNQYLYVIFTSEQERVRLTNSIEIKQNVGKFYAESERDNTFKGPVKLFSDDIPISANEEDVKNILAQMIGIVKEVTFWDNKGNNQYKRATVILEVTCTDKQFYNIWSLKMGEHNRIKITPANISVTDKKRRTQYTATIIGLDDKLELKDVHDIMTELNAKEWYFNTRYGIDVYFENGRERDNAVRKPFIINNKKYTWVQDTRGQQPFWDNFNGDRTIITPKAMDTKIMDMENIIMLTEMVSNMKVKGIIEEEDHINNTNTNNLTQEVTTDIITTITPTTTTEEQAQKDTTDHKTSTIAILTEIDDIIMETTQNNITDTGTTIEMRMNDIINQDSEIIGIPVIVMDTNPTLINIEKDDNEGRVEGEESMNIDHNEFNIELKNYIEKNNKNKEKFKNQNTKINNIIKIGVLNIRGLNDENDKKNKKENLKNYITKENWDVTGINETKLKTNKGCYIYKDWNGMKILNNSADDIKSLGSQLMIVKRWIEIRMINYKEVKGYAQSIDVILKGKEMDRGSHKFRY
ncbi:hypothetical protein C1646_767499 [Rhizophagus diaphanus]|nr:hypothetical protein C1646_767499 [Rhizophagus diaphanus] [Rhizophagus sp. MUCL 43196]